MTSAQTQGTAPQQAAPVPPLTEVDQAVSPTPEAVWPVPDPLPPVDEIPLPTLDHELVPSPLRSWVLDSAERMGAPPEAILVGALISAATLVGNTIRVHPKSLDTTWAEAPNVFGLLIGPPSTKKSALFKEGLRFLSKIDGEHASQHSKERYKRGARSNRLDKTLRRLDKELQKAASEAECVELEEQYESALAELEDVTANPRRLILGDITSEKLVMILAEPVNRSGTLVARDEFAGLLEQMSRSGHENDRPLYLQGYNGTGPYDADRVMREGNRIPTLTLSMYGTIQPTVLKPFIDATRSGKKDDGFLQRFQLTVWIDSEASSMGVNRAPDDAAFARAEAVYQHLDASTRQREGALETNEFEGVIFSVDAQEEIDAWVERRLSEAKRYEQAGQYAFSAHLGKGRGMISRLALLYHLIDQAGGGTDETISLRHAQQAIQLMDYFHSHAHRTYQVPFDPDHRKLEILWELLPGDAIKDGMRFRDAQRDLRKIGKTKNEILPILQKAERLGWLRLVDVPNPGARPSTCLYINPALRP